MKFKLAENAELGRLSGDFPRGAPFAADQKSRVGQVDGSAQLHVGIMQLAEIDAADVPDMETVVRDCLKIRHAGEVRDVVYEGDLPSIGKKKRRKVKRRRRRCNDHVAASHKPAG